MQSMRTTITLEPQTAALVEQAMREQDRSFKDVVNEAIRTGLSAHTPPQRVKLPTHDAGKPRMNLDKAVQLAGELEDQEILRKMSMGK